VQRHTAAGNPHQGADQEKRLEHQKYAEDGESAGEKLRFAIAEDDGQGDRNQRRGPSEKQQPELQAENEAERRADAYRPHRHALLAINPKTSLISTSPTHRTGNKKTHNDYKKRPVLLL
jgi:hypothetical protein